MVTTPDRDNADPQGGPALSILSSLLRVLVGGCRMLVSKLTMLERRKCVLLCLFVLAEIVMMGCLMMMMGGGVVVSGGVVVMLARRMLRCLYHLYDHSYLRITRERQFN
jgi:hypothetical protein